MPIAAHSCMHIGQRYAPHDIWQSLQSPEPATIAIACGVATAAVLYVHGVRRLWARAGHGRGIARWRAASFGVGVLSLMLAVAPPVDVLSGDLFAVHMSQHLVIMTLAAPLLVAGEPWPTMLWAFDAARRRSIAHWWQRQAVARAAARGLVHPVVALLLHVATIWAWHVPRLYDAALRTAWLHGLEHFLFFSTALLFWHSVLDRRAIRRLGVPMAVLSLFVVALQSVVLGALLSMSDRTWYLAHVASTAAWGLLPVEDQQLAGLIMWVPGGVAYSVAALALLVPVLSRNPQRARASGNIASGGMVAGTRAAAYARK